MSFMLIIKRRFTKKYKLDLTTLTINLLYLLKVFCIIISIGYTTIALDFRILFNILSPF